MTEIRSCGARGGGGARCRGGGRAVTAGPREALLPLPPKVPAHPRRLGHRDEPAGDVLVQDALLLALRSWDTFAAGTSLKAWLFRILHTRHLSLRHRHARHLEVGVEADVLAR